MLFHSCFKSASGFADIHEVFCEAGRCHATNGVNYICQLTMERFTYGEAAFGTLDTYRIVQEGTRRTSVLVTGVGARTGRGGGRGGEFGSH